MIHPGTVELNIGPGRHDDVSPPYRPDTDWDGHYYDLVISTRLKHDTIWAGAGHEVAFGEFQLTKASCLCLWYA